MRPELTSQHFLEPCWVYSKRVDSGSVAKKWRFRAGGGDGAFTPQRRASSSPKRDEMKGNFWSQPPNADSRFAERRSVPRHDFVAPIENTVPIRKTHISSDVTEISQRDCFAEVPRSLADNPIIQLRIQRDESTFETLGRVIYNRPGIRLGLVFIDTAPDQSKLLPAWLDGLKGS